MPVTLAPVFTTSVAGCGVTYSIVGNTDASLSTFDPSDGSLIVNTADPAKHGAIFEITVTATCDVSGAQASNSYTLTIDDPCQATTLSPPTALAAALDMEVFASQTIQFNPAMDSVGSCGPISYSVIGLAIVSNSLTGTDVLLSPNDMSEIGAKSFTLQATLDNYPAISV